MYVFVPDPQPPQQQGLPPQYLFSPPLPPNTKTPKPGKGLSAKRAKKISDDWLKLVAEIEEAKNKGKKPDKKREGLNWIELSLLLVFISPLIAGLEIGAAIMVVHLLGK